MLDATPEIYALQQRYLAAGLFTSDPISNNFGVNFSDSPRHPVWLNSYARTRMPASVGEADFFRRIEQQCGKTF